MTSFHDKNTQQASPTTNNKTDWLLFYSIMLPIILVGQLGIMVLGTLDWQIFLVNQIALIVLIGKTTAYLFDHSQRASQSKATRLAVAICLPAFLLSEKTVLIAWQSKDMGGAVVTLLRDIVSDTYCILSDLVRSSFLEGQKPRKLSCFSVCLVLGRPRKQHHARHTITSVRSSRIVYF